MVPLRLAVIAACAIPVAAALGLILVFGENVAAVDDWRIVTSLHDYEAGQLGLGDLYEQHVAHRIPFPLFGMLVLALLTDFNCVANMVASLTVQVATLATLLLMYRRRFGRDDPLALGFVPIAFLLFSFAQFGTFLNGFSLTYTMGLGGAVMGLACLDRALRCAGARAWGWFAGAVLAATVASFSSAMGLFVWFAGLLLILIAPAPGALKKGFGMAWSSIALIEWVAYFTDYTTEFSEVTLFPLFTAPVEALLFSVTLLGHALFWNEGASLWGGVLLAGFAVLALALAFRRGRMRELAFWIAALSFFGVSAHSVVQSRMSLGIRQALVSHYCCMTLPIVACIYVLLLDLWKSSRTRGTALAFGGFLILVLTSVPFAFLFGLDKAGGIQAHRRQAAFILRTYETQPKAMLRKIHPSGRAVRHYAPFLERRGLNVFSTPTRLPVDPGRDVQTSLGFMSLHLVDRVPPGLRRDGVLRVPRGLRMLHLSGWAFDPIAQRPAGGVLIEIDGRTYPAFYGGERLGLVKGRGQAYRFCGFERGLDLDAIGLGPHELSIRVLNADRSAVFAPRRRYSFIVE